jgi:CubicO group peptidase (beta-lactamase class C family)
MTCCLSPFDSPHFLRRLDRLFVEALVERTFSGASLLVARPDLVLFHKTWGLTHQGGCVVDEHTFFDLASLTKPLATAPLCMRAVGEGKIALDDTLLQFFPSDLLPADKRGISIRQLLSHSSGFPAYEPFYRKLIFIEPSRRQLSLLEEILHTPLVSDPGTASCYSDLGFMLLGMILEIVYGRPIDQLASQFLFQPLGLGFECPNIALHAQEGTPTKAALNTSLTHDRGPSTSSAPCSLPPTPYSLLPDNEAALGFCRSLAPTDPTILSERPTATERVFAATEDCPWRKRLLAGEVHDENAYCLGGVAGHAGLFGTTHGVFELLAFLWKVYRGIVSDQSWTAEVVQEFWTRHSAVPETTWMLGYDSPSPDNSSAGNHFSPGSPGHLGFTGTSFWFDLVQEVLVILLTNRVYPTRENDRLKRFRPAVHNLVMETYHGTPKS